MRSFELQIYDEQLNLTDRYPLPNAVSPSGLGFSLKITTVEGDTKDYIIKQAVDKKSIKLTVNFENPNAYSQSRSLRSWIGANTTNKMVMMYNDGEGRETGQPSKMYFECKVQSVGVTEVNTDMLSMPIVILPLTPMYSVERKSLVLRISGASKTYPYSYPYSYGGGTASDPTILNSFFAEVPLDIRIQGKVVSPIITLTKEVNGETSTYATISFPTVTVEKGEVLEVNGIDQSIKLYSSGYPSGVDYYNYKDHSKDTFLFMDPGVSSITTNLDQNEAKAKVIVTYTLYSL